MVQKAVLSHLLPIAKALAGLPLLRVMVVWVRGHGTHWQVALPHNCGEDIPNTVGPRDGKIW